VLELVGDVAVVVWLLGSARGATELLDSIHGPRLERLLERLVDTPVRGFAYEVEGTVPGDRLEHGREIVERASRTWRIPVALLRGERSAPGWAERTARELGSLLES
jgi:hypothetical protein